MNILITGAWSSARENIGILEKMGHSVRFMEFEKDELPCEYNWVEGVICNGLFLNHSIEKFTHLKYIQLTSAGFDRVPIDYVKKHDIKIFNAKGVYSIPMAEYAVAGVLQLYKHSRFFYENQKTNCWEKHRGLLELYGKTVCIVGCGSVGTECAKRFTAFGCNVIGVDLHPRQDNNYKKMVDISELDMQLPEADVVVLTLPLTEKTKYIMNTERLCLLKRSAVIVNIARGAVIDTSALICVLSRIGGAVLDVFEEEPLDQNNQLWKMENVVITPHNSFVGAGNKNRLTEVILSNMGRIRQDESAFNSYGAKSYMPIS